MKVVLAPVAGDTHIKITHGPFGAGAKWAETVTGLETGWRYSLENLASVLATGEDLRFTRRPVYNLATSS